MKDPPRKVQITSWGDNWGREGNSQRVSRRPAYLCELLVCTIPASIDKAVRCKLPQEIHCQAHLSLEMTHDAPWRPPQVYTVNPLQYTCDVQCHKRCNQPRHVNRTTEECLPSYVCIWPSEHYTIKCLTSYIPILTQHCWWCHQTPSPTVQSLWALSWNTIYHQTSWMSQWTW